MFSFQTNRIEIPTLLLRIQFHLNTLSPVFIMKLIRFVSQKHMFFSPPLSPQWCGRPARVLGVLVPCRSSNPCRRRSLAALTLVATALCRRSASICTTPVAFDVVRRSPFCLLLGRFHPFAFILLTCPKPYPTPSPVSSRIINTRYAGGLVRHSPKVAIQGSV